MGVGGQCFAAMDGGETAADGARETRAAATRLRRQVAAVGKQPVSTIDPGPAQAADADLEARESIPAARGGLKKGRAPTSKSRATSSVANRPQTTDAALPQVWFLTISHLPRMLCVYVWVFFYSMMLRVR